MNTSSCKKDRLATVIEGAYKWKARAWRRALEAEEPVVVLSHWMNCSMVKVSGRAEPDSLPEEGAAGVAAGLVAEGVAGSASSTGEGVAEGAALEAGEGVAEAAGLEGVEGALPPVEAPSQTLGPGTVYSVAPP